MTDPEPTLADLKAARAELARREARWENYDGNNPEKYQADIQAARREVERLTAALKANGTLPYTAQEILVQALDALAPDARHGDVITHEGVRYRRRFTPAEKSRSSRVTAWRGHWERVSDP